MCALNCCGVWCVGAVVGGTMTPQRSDNVLCWYNDGATGRWLALLSALLGSCGVLAYTIYYRCVGSWADGVLAVINALKDQKKLTIKFGNLN